MSLYLDGNAIRYNSTQGGLPAADDKAAVNTNLFWYAEVVQRYHKFAMHHTGQKSECFCRCTIDACTRILAHTGRSCRAFGVEHLGGEDPTEQPNVCT